MVSDPLRSGPGTPGGPGPGEAPRQTLGRLSLGAVTFAALVVLQLASLSLMSDATRGSARFGELFSVLLVINAAGLLLLATAIGWNLYRLFVQVRHRLPGARLTARVMAVFVALAVTPVVVVYYFSLDFLHRGIDSWFDVRVDQALEDSLELSQTALGVRMRELLKQTELMAGDLAELEREELARTLDDARRLSGANELTVLGKGQILAFSNIEPTAIVPSSLDETVEQQLRQSGDYIGLDHIGTKGLFVRVATYIPSDDPTIEPRILAALYPFTQRMSALADSVQAAYAQYRELAYLRNPLKVSFTLTLTLVLALSLLAAVWAALFSARRMVAPLRDLATGTQAVASGDLGTRLPISSNDEVGFLVESFNEMTQRLSEARDETRQSQQRVEEQRTFLEVVLARLSSGVITVDHDLRVYTANRAAEQILDLDHSEASGKTIEELARAQEYLAPLARVLRERLTPRVAGAGDPQGWRAELVLSGAHGERTLTLSGAPLTAPDGVFTGHVLVIDDITTLVRAQRSAAWSEVARRLAHEIKNPLTPIQLSAERLRHKYLPRMEAEEGATLDRLTHTIVQQVDAMKKMVNAFSDYARAPRMEFERTDLNRLVSDVVDLYRAGAESTDVSLQLDAAADRVDIDRNRIRQVLHNLVKNAQEASRASGEPRIEIRTLAAPGEAGDYLELSVRDHGPGIPDEMLEHVFEPYVTSKPKGTGLGLAIVKKIAEEHGGTVRAENHPRGGAVLVVRLPASRDRGQQPEAAAQ